MNNLTENMADTLLSANKCVIMIDQHLPIGVIANTAAVLSLSIGKLFPQLIGHDLKDNMGNHRHGITTVAIPILKSNGSLLKEMRQTLKEHESLTIIDVISATQTTKSYADYAREYESTQVEQLVYFGIALYGDKKIVNKYTGSLGLLR